MAKAMKGKFLVIGGQYNYVFYGLKATERSAKILATKNIEYWDNWQGWHKPLIYELAEEMVLPSNADVFDVILELWKRAEKPGYAPISRFHELLDTDVFVHY